jgi:hypothetical protein
LGLSIRSGRNYFQKFGLFWWVIDGQCGPARDARDLWSGDRAFVELSHLFSDRSWDNELGKRGVLRCKAGETDDPAIQPHWPSQLHAGPDKSG